MIKNTNNSPSFFSSLSDMLNQSHPLYQLADKIDWEKFETAFEPLYYQGYCKCAAGSSGIQLQKSNESSFVRFSKNQRDTV